jgi:DNA-binding MarR family transcriptional regulator
MARLGFIGLSNDSHFPWLVNLNYDGPVDGDDARDEAGTDALSGVFQLAREMRRQIHEVMADEPWACEAGFRPPCMGVLDVVAKLQPVSQREISDHLGLDASDVVGVLDILENAAMVQRRRDPHDRRRHAVVLTELGETAARHFAAVRARAVDRALANLDAQEREQLAELLRRATAGSRTAV